ncbi:hypothetical protein PILCRDRAFT_7001 [Piloderma croceum F 1598]|uniref:Uncharacterized protein n=1 Tax=Piloderma croceum (strain F 1598) TaxID=765440 RepID=A0A0C3FGW7_PILCF|nr:hypothetical protein PILCRDRAFT_7001 [Piloderma croceum F 1598]
MSGEGGSTHKRSVAPRPYENRFGYRWIRRYRELSTTTPNKVTGIAQWDFGMVVSKLPFSQPSQLLLRLGPPLQEDPVWHKFDIPAIRTFFDTYSSSKARKTEVVPWRPLVNDRRVEIVDILMASHQGQYGPVIYGNPSKIFAMLLEDMDGVMRM